MCHNHNICLPPQHPRPLSPHFSLFRWPSWCCLHGIGYCVHSPYSAAPTLHPPLWPHWPLFRLPKSLSVSVPIAPSRRCARPRPLLHRLALCFTMRCRRCPHGLSPLLRSKCKHFQCLFSGEITGSTGRYGQSVQQRRMSGMPAALDACVFADTGACSSAFANARPWLKF